MLHQDGFGTVDSEHTNLHGYNEVVILRRMPQCHKENARKLWPSLRENSLYGLPHDNVKGEDEQWATEETIAEYERMK